MLNLIKGASKAAGANGLYKYHFEPDRYPDFVYTDRTIQQLKNSGGLRLITNKEVSDSITAYDASVKMLAIHISEAIVDQLHIIRQLNTRLYDFRCCPELGEFVSPENIKYPMPGAFLTYDDKVITEYYNNVQAMRRQYNIQRDILGALKSQNERLQEFLKKEYHLK